MTSGSRLRNKCKSKKTSFFFPFFQMAFSSVVSINTKDVFVKCECKGCICQGCEQPKCFRAKQSNLKNLDDLNPLARLTLLITVAALQNTLHYNGFCSNGELVICSWTLNSFISAALCASETISVAQWTLLLLHTSIFLSHFLLECQDLILNVHKRLAAPSSNLKFICVRHQILLFGWRLCVPVCKLCVDSPLTQPHNYVAPLVLCQFDNCTKLNATDANHFTLQAKSNFHPLPNAR